MKARLSLCGALLLSLAASGCLLPSKESDALRADAAQTAGSRTEMRPIPDSELALLEPPVQLQAAGAPIDVGDQNGYAGPALFDCDGDRRLDLLVGSFDGKIRLYPNVGSASAPAFGAGALMQAQGKDVEVSNW